MIKESLCEILQILSISIFEKVPVNQLFQHSKIEYFIKKNDNKLEIFNLQLNASDNLSYIKRLVKLVSLISKTLDLINFDNIV